MIDNFFLLHVKKAFGPFVKGGVYWIDRTNAMRVPKGNDIYQASVIPKYTNQHTMLLVRSGGMGDIMALSSLVGIAENTIVLTQNKYKPLGDYFSEKCTFKSFQEPLFVTKFPQRLEDYISEIGMMYGDMVIENGDRRNWFEVLSESVNQPFDEEYGRPQLKSLSTKTNDTCIVVPSASCINRTADRNILKDVASRYFETVVMADEQKWTTAQYLQALDEAKFVISVDTSAIHFREGIKKPALGIYGAFTTDSRTKYYKYTDSIDVVSGCPLQPCFKHEQDICPHVTKESTHAPCLTGHALEWNIHQYLTNKNQ